MKYNKIISLAAAALLVCGCADNDDMYNGDVGQNGYTYLKSYVNRSDNPNFKLGTGVSAADFFKHNRAWAVTKNNFDELTPGNLMKFGSIVKDDGYMDFRGVTDLVNQAREAGMTVYGHTLCWHSQQNVTYLKSLLAPPNYFLHVTSSEAKTNPWDGNITYTLSKPLEVGAKYTISFKGKASSGFDMPFWPTSDAATDNTQYLGAFQFTKEWSVLSQTFDCKKPLIKLNFEFGPFKGDFCIDDITLVKEGTTDNLLKNSHFDDDNIGMWSKPGYHTHTTMARDKEEAENAGDEEAAKDSLNKVLDKWVGGMMQACQGKVKAFDAINEPMSDSAPTELKKAGRDGDTKTNFFWQDYLGKDYARTVIALARQYGPSDLKLFVNEYGLEGDDNEKCKGLIDMIKYWESDGTTKIDGIGTQMHVTLSMDPKKQEKNEKNIANMFKLLAATGKLIKVSELDMGIEVLKVSEQNDSTYEMVETNNATVEMLQAQKDFYRYIVKAYFDNIPAAQRYGITQWCQTDAPNVENAWRRNQPVGLWNKDFVRKPAYEGFADGLAGRNIFVHFME